MVRVPRGLLDETTRRLAKSADLDVRDVALAAAVLFDATVTEERDRRTAATERSFRSSDERRGAVSHISRDLRAAITEAISNIDKGASR